MPQDSIMDMVNNIEGLYNDKNAMFDTWVEEGDVWSERQALREALALAGHFAEALETSEPDGTYSQSDIREAADEMLEEFEEYRDEAIKAAVAKAARTEEQIREEMKMDAGDVEYAKKYEELARKIGIDELKNLIPASREKVRKALERGDKHLNTIPLRKWDAAGVVLRIPGLSLSEKVGVLKHVAMWHYA